MKRYIKLLASLFVVFFTTVSSTSAALAADTNNFTISDFTVDYYLTRDEQGTSHLQTEEDITAIFPDYNQNHGIYRFVKTAIADGGVRTMGGISTLYVYRNGDYEEATYEQDGKAYLIRIGDANTYVHGEQTYTLEYRHYDVVLDQSDEANAWQEFYWDVNGTGWEQTIQHLTAHVHLTDELLGALRPRKSCFVGARGSLDESGCTITETDDGFIFTADYIPAGQTMSLVLTFEPGTFDAPTPQTSYFMVVVAAVIIGVGFLLLLFALHKRASVKEKIDYYKGLPIPPQYIPLKGYTVAELNTVAIKPGVQSQVATLLELAVSHKIELVKGEKKRFGSYQWSINVKSISGLSAMQLKTLQLLNGGEEVQAGSVIEIKNHSSNAKLLQLSKEIKESPISTVTERGDLVDKPKGLNTIGLLTTMWLILNWISFGFASSISDTIYAHIIGESIFPFIIIAFSIVMAIILFKLQSDYSTYATRTTQGLDHSNYFEGLRLYIKMAETDRLNFLQSVEGADTSTKGIVKLYERLLPYATLFGLEKSWSNELARYYEQNPDLTPAWYVGGAAAFSASDFHSSLSSLSSTISTSSSSSSGSGFSGGAGGGGGGGGGGGW